jgi:hypothetical protein
MGANEGGWFGVENDVVVVVGVAEYHEQGGQVLGWNPETKLPGLNYGHVNGNGCGRQWRGWVGCGERDDGGGGCGCLIM